MSARYELRNRNGFGQLFSIGAAGKIATTGRRLSEGNCRERALTIAAVHRPFNGRAAYRPLASDKYALLLSYNHRETLQQGSFVNNVRQADLRDRTDTLSGDGLYQATRDLEIYGRFALRFNANGNTLIAYASSLTYLAQIRAQEKLGDNFDIAAELRMLNQPDSNTFRRSAGAEIGYWIMPDLRFAAGYNFTRANKFNNIFPDNNRQFRSGFYFTVTTKLSNLFDLFGTARQGLASEANAPTNADAAQNEKK
jgi:hypothetical protein